MKWLSILCLLTLSNWALAQEKYILVIHGGAGAMTKEMMTPQMEKQYKEKLTESLHAGYQQLKNGKSSLEAIEAAIIVMENSPLFNAGKGAVFTHEGKNELDASVMLGKDKSAGAVAGVTTIKNPIKAAIAVMQKSKHVLLSGKGAEEFAKEQNIELVDPKYFWTEDRWKGLQKALEREKNASKPSAQYFDSKEAFLMNDSKFGTVGAVALDKDGNIAAGTSTGGMTNKRWNRLGDSPIIGAGTYANEQVGVSGTGWGEYFIRSTAARTLAAKMEYQNKSVQNAGQEVIDEIEKMGGDGGLIALDKNGNIAAGTSTGGMTNKKYGRIGDAPIIGAGTYANSQVGISATGWGEYFIRATAARTVAAKMEYQNKEIKTATQETIDEIGKMGGDGGMIALDKDGNVAMPFNTAGMYRGAITDNGEIIIEIYK